MPLFFKGLKLVFSFQGFRFWSFGLTEFGVSAEEFSAVYFSDRNPGKHRSSLLALSTVQPQASGKKRDM